MRSWPHSRRMRATWRGSVVGSTRCFNAESAERRGDTQSVKLMKRDNAVEKNSGPRAQPSFLARSADAGQTNLHENETSHLIIGAAIEVHRFHGPGLVEQVYEESLCHEFALRSLPFERQKPVPIYYKEVRLGSDLRLDLIVHGRVIVDNKAKEEILPIDRTKCSHTCVFPNFAWDSSLIFIPVSSKTESFE